jgi:hypothetical protein
MNSALLGRVVTFILCLLLISPVASSAASAGQFVTGVSGPVAGYILDSNSGNLRPILGILGSSTLGKPMDLGYTLDQALTLGPRFAIVSASGNAELQILDLETSPPSAAAIAGVPSGPSVAVASLHATSAAVYHPEARQVWILTGLPQKPKVSHSIDLSLLGQVKQMAVRDDGQVLVFSAIDRGEESLYAWSAALESIRVLTPTVSIGGIAMTGNGGAIVADRGTNEVFAFWDAGGASIRQFLVGAEDGVASPVGVAVSASGRIHIANSASSTTMTLDPGGRFLSIQNCGCDISGVYPLKDFVYRLTNRMDRTIFLLDASTAEDRLLFIPTPEGER